jgi:hypothetical protein
MRITAENELRQISGAASGCDAEIAGQEIHSIIGMVLRNAVSPLLNFISVSVDSPEGDTLIPPTIVTDGADCSTGRS